MAQWKKLITSGSNAVLNDITASGHLSISASSADSDTYEVLVRDPINGRVYATSSFANISTSDTTATQILLGDSTTGLFDFVSNTNVQDALDSIDTILGLLAPDAPASLASVSLEFVSTNFEGIGINGQSTSSITIASPQIFQTTQPFFDGDSGTLTAFSSSNGGETFSEGGSRILTTADDSGTYNNLTIISDSDPYEGESGTSGFYKQLSCQLKSLFSPGSSKKVVKLTHSGTGTTPNFEFFVEKNNYSIINSASFKYDEADHGFHYQSGIKYLGAGNQIETSYTVQIDSQTDFLNSQGRIGRVDTSPDISNAPTKTINSSWSAGDVFGVTSSLSIDNDKFNNGNIIFAYRKFRASTTTPALGSSINSSDQFTAVLVDSKIEDETDPSEGQLTTFRSGSGKGPKPVFALGNTDITKCGQSFNASSSLASTDNYELQFSDGRFRWPSNQDYTNCLPSGPDYSNIESIGDTGNSGRRYALFNIGEIDSQPGVDIIIKNATGFDTVFNGDPSFQQSSNNFSLQIIVMETGTNTRVTNWINANEPYDLVSDTTLIDNQFGAVTTGTIASSGDLVRKITFGAGGVKTGTVYVRIGFSQNTTRAFSYIYKI